MQRLKHPVRSITEPFGKAGLTVAILALVLAMVGGAYAAGGLTSQQEKQVKKIAKKYAGKPGAAGANGTNGTNGAAGANGKDGTNGGIGSPGANGKTVLSGTATPSVGTGSEGDFYIKTAGPTAPEIFGPKTAIWGSGTKLKGEKGEPWTAGGTLPSGATETGSWSFGPISKASIPPGFGYFVPIASFNVPLAAPLKNEPECGEISKPACAAHYVKEGVTPPAECKNEEHAGEPSAANPEAAKGNFCVYGSFESEIVPLEEEGILNPGTLEHGTGTSGAIANIKREEATPGAVMVGFGTWAVTAP